jgi:hypothetical protein
LSEDGTRIKKRPVSEFSMVPFFKLIEIGSKVFGEKFKKKRPERKRRKVYFWLFYWGFLVGGTAVIVWIGYHFWF